MPLKASHPHVSVQVFEQFQDLVSEAWLGRVVEYALAIEPEHRTGAVSVVIADDGTVTELNRRYRGLEESTDVLSFSFSHQGQYYGDGDPRSEWSGNADFVLPPGEGAGLGEVIISYPQVARQAEESSRLPQRELAHVLAHGILHLLGHDHIQPEEETAMKAKEAAVLAQVFEDG